MGIVIFQNLNLIKTLIGRVIQSIIGGKAIKERVDFGKGLELFSN